MITTFVRIANSLLSSSLLWSGFLVSGMRPSVRISSCALQIRSEDQDVSPQRAEGKATASQLNFEVASIRPSNPDGKATSNVSLTPGRSFVPINGTFRTTNQPLFVYILFAYKVQVSEAWDLLQHLPKWVVSDKYDIEARTEEPNPTKDQLREMMRALLKDRFKLQSHRETVQREVLALQMRRSKLGPLLQRHFSDDACSVQGATSSQHTSVMSVPITSLLSLHASHPLREETVQ
jgi:uncharacterized protein (TIGR03435 family)